MKIKRKKTFVICLVPKKFFFVFFIERKRNDDKHFWSKKQKAQNRERMNDTDINKSIKKKSSDFLLYKKH